MIRFLVSHESLDLAKFENGDARSGGHYLFKRNENKELKTTKKGKREAKKLKTKKPNVSPSPHQGLLRVWRARGWRRLKSGRQLNREALTTAEEGGKRHSSAGKGQASASRSRGPLVRAP